MSLPGLHGPGATAHEPGAAAMAWPVFFNEHSGDGIDADTLRAAGRAHGLALEPVPFPADERALAEWQARRPAVWAAAG